ncbi:hypothetical protein Cantr_00605 [Candida viswanathii]|uniref:Uncharacterized protein n=1 Tax=Candida viswanathii TaxID=5486 RepID=A0A367YGS6_9ASCO|nr:hypothetical protein Cantr_00605 [Candida viswanathii]
MSTANNSQHKSHPPSPQHKLHPVHPIIHHNNTAPEVTHFSSKPTSSTDKDPDQASNKTMPTDSYTTTTNEDGEKFKQRQIDDLFAALKGKLSDKYRFIEFKPETKRNTSHYKKVVSFDDMDLHYEDDGLPDPDDDFGWELYKMRNRGRKGSGNLPGYGRDELLRSLAPMSSHLSPSPVRNTLDLDSRLDLMQMENNLVQYPTTPISKKKSCTLRKRHKLFDTLSEQKLILRPMFRTILVYISARIHTWVALDWVLSQFIENGDHVIIVAAVDPRLVEYARSSKRGRSSAVSPSLSPQRGATLSPGRGRMGAPLSPARSRTEETPLGRLAERSKPSNVVKIADDIMNYVMEVINPNIISKITVEIVEGRTKDVLKDIYRLYEPNLVCTGSKPNSKMGAPLRSWQSSKLTDRLVKNFPLPVIAVPAMNMCDFEDNLQSKINNGKEIPRQKISQIVESEEEEDEEDSEDEDEIRSINSAISFNSYDSYYEVGQQFVEYKETVEKGLDKLKQAPLNQDYYANIALFVSDESLKFCSDIIDIQPSFAGHGADLARAITGSNSFGKAGYKSMLDTSQNKKEELPQNKMSFKEVKEQLRLNKIKTELESTSSSSMLPPPPSIDVSGPTPSPSPTPSPTREPSLLKFVNLERPSGNGDRKKLELRTSPLRKCLSHSDETTSTPQLEPRKSHPGMLEHSRDGSHKKKSKKKKFWLF